MSHAWQTLFPTTAGMTLFALSLTLGSYLLGIAVQRRLQHALANPVLISIVLVGATLRMLHIDYATYFNGAQIINFLLGPATVALAIPLVRSLEHIRRSLKPMLAGLLAGSLTAMLTGYALVRLLGGSQPVAFSTMVKSVTTPIAISVAQQVGGLPAVSAVLAIAGGILVAVAIDALLARMKVTDQAARGLGAGTAGSAIGASRVIPQHPLAAAFAAIAIGLNGMITAIFAPGLAWLLRHW